MSEGIRRFIYGLAKKVLIADVLGACVDTIYGFEIGNVNGSFAWIAALFYSLQLYMTFQAIPIWLWVWEKCSASICRKILITPIWLRPSRNFGADGT